MQDYFILFSQGSNVKKAIKTYNFILIIKKINVNSVLSFGRRKEVPFANERSYTVNIELKVFFLLLWFVFSRSLLSSHIINQCSVQLVAL